MNLIEFEKLEINNFRSFRGKHEFDFSEYEPGIYQIIGKNGEGKSSLVEAIYWVLCGKTTANLKAGSIHSWGTKGGTSGRLEFLLGESSHVLERKWNPNKLLLDGETIDESEVENLIKLNAETLKYSVFVPQFSQMFFDLQPAKKLELFSTLLDLDYWMDCSKQASKLATSVQSKLNKLEQDKQYYEGQIDQLTVKANEYDKQLEEFDSKQKEKIIARKKDLKELEQQKKELTDKVPMLKKSLQEDEKELSDLEEDLDKLNNSLEEINDGAKKDLMLELADIKIEKRNVLKALKKFDDMGAVCPECEQDIPEVYMKKRKTSYNSEMKKLNKKENKSIDELTEVEEEMESINEQIKELKNIKSDLQSGINNYRVEINSCESKARTFTQGINVTSREVKELEREENPYEKLLIRAVDDIEKMDKNIEKIGKEVKDKDKKLNAYNYWAKAFKDLRLFVVEDVLTHLEVEVNNYVHDLGLEGWEIQFDVEKENKTGGVSKGFHVLISSPESGEPVDWLCYSGGEQMRLRLAGQLGLQSLIFQSYGVDSNLMILDEATKHLTHEGIQDLLDLLEDKAINEERQIWCIDHHSHDYGFNDTILVEKDKEGSHIRKSH